MYLNFTFCYNFTKNLINKYFFLYVILNFIFRFKQCILFDSNKYYRIFKDIALITYKLYIIIIIEPIITFNLKKIVINVI